MKTLNTLITALLIALFFTTGCGLTVKSDPVPKEEPKRNPQITLLEKGNCPLDPTGYRQLLYEILVKTSPEEQNTLRPVLRECAYKAKTKVAQVFVDKRIEYARANAAFTDGESAETLVIYLKTDHLETEDGLVEGISKSLEGTRTLAYLEYLGFKGVVYRTDLKVIPFALRPGRYEHLRQREIDKTLKEMGLYESF